MPTQHATPRSSVAAFAAFPAAQAETLRRLARHRRWRNGAVVMSYGNVVSGVLGITQGRLRITATTNDGNEVFFRWYHPGEVAGLLSAVDRLPSPVDAVAADDFEALEVDREVLIATLRTDAAMGAAVSRILARHAWDVCNLVTARTAHVLTERVFGVVSHLARVNGKRREDGGWELAISQKDIAEAVGASRQRVNLELRALEDDGRIRLGYGHIVLLEREHVAAAAVLDHELGLRFKY